MRYIEHPADWDAGARLAAKISEANMDNDLLHTWAGGRAAEHDYTRKERTAYLHGFVEGALAAAYGELAIKDEFDAV